MLLAPLDTALYFGCRSKGQDMYFAEEMETWKKHGVHVRVACSRDQVRPPPPKEQKGLNEYAQHCYCDPQENKIYVQTLIKEDSELIRDWIVKRNGNVYISGQVPAVLV